MKKFVFIAILLFCININASIGIIDNVNNKSKVCKNVNCDVFGILNWKADDGNIVIDDINGLSGYIWGNEMGWINLKPINGGIILNANTGNLSGYAWSQNSGWINFSPTNGGVKINKTNGNFEGWAWSGGQYGGWIKFDCNDNACVNTSWREQVNASSSGSISGGGSYIANTNSVDIVKSVDIYYDMNPTIDNFPEREYLEENMSKNNNYIKDLFFGINETISKDIDNKQEIKGYKEKSNIEQQRYIKQVNKDRENIIYWLLILLIANGAIILSKIFKHMI